MERTHTDPASAIRRPPGSVILVDAFRCRMWALHDRLDEYVNEDSCKSEIESFSRHGQLVAALGRPVQGDPRVDVELICGARRLFVARYLNKPLSVELRPMSDREAFVAMDIENRHRKDISAYERGLSYARWMRNGHFDSQEDLSRALRISTSQVSRLLNVARLPSVILNAFGSPDDLCETWGRDLFNAWTDVERRALLASRAREIAAERPRPSPRQVFDRLMAEPSPGPKPRHKQRDEVVKGDDGSPVMRIRRQRKFVALVVPADKLSVQKLDQIKQSICKILQSDPPSRAPP